LAMDTRRLTHESWMQLLAATSWAAGTSQTEHLS
jgi:hypothetical protein